jgi:hypothetical protein
MKAIHAGRSHIYPGTNGQWVGSVDERAIREDKENFEHYPSLTHYGTRDECIQAIFEYFEKHIND